MNRSSSEEPKIAPGVNTGVKESVAFFETHFARFARESRLWKMMSSIVFLLLYPGDHSLGRPNRRFLAPGSLFCPFRPQHQLLAAVQPHTPENSLPFSTSLVPGLLLSRAPAWGPPARALDPHLPELWDPWLLTHRCSYPSNPGLGLDSSQGRPRPVLFPFV